MGAVIVFDLTNTVSYEHVKYWLRELRLHADENICKIVIGNKCDMKESIQINDN
jgi:GTPase SAR1 family protein